MTRWRYGPVIGSERAAAVWAILILLLGLAGSGWLAWRIHRDGADQVRAALRLAARLAADDVAVRVERYQYGLRGARGVIVSHGAAEASRQDFHVYSQSRDIAAEFPGALAFGYIQRVPPEQAASFERQARQDGAPGFSIFQLHAHAGERAVVRFIEPEAMSRQALGLDIASEDNRRAAAEAALRSGETRLTAPIALESRPSSLAQSLLMLMPVYRGGATPASEAARLQAGMGWTFATIRLEPALRDALQAHPGLSMELSDVTEAGGPLPLYRSNPVGGEERVAASEDVRQALHGRLWRMRFDAGPAFIASLRLPSPESYGLAGAALSALASLAAYLLGRGQYRRRQFAAAQSRLAGIVENSIDAMIGKSLAGVVTSWNQGAERMFGYAEAEAIGRRLADLIVPEDRLHEELDILARIGRGERVEHFETVRRSKDGGLIPVSVAISPILSGDGLVVGASKVARDISVQKRAEAELHELNDRLETLVASRTAELEQARNVLQAVLDAVPSMIGYWDREQRNRVANHACKDWFGLEPEQVLGRSLRELLGEEPYRDSLPWIEGALRGEPQSFERRVMRADGSMRYALVQYLPDVVDGVVQGFYAVSHDVTELEEGRSQLADALRNREALLDTINQQLLYSVTDAEGRIREVNDLFCLTHGYARDELLGGDHKRLGAGTHPAAFWQAMWSAISAGRPWRGEICNQTRDGHLRWLDTVIVPHVGASGRIERYIALRIDITERRLADAELARVHRLLSNMLRAASATAIIAMDVGGVITQFNSGAQRMLGYQEGEVVGRIGLAHFHQADELSVLEKELREREGLSIQGFGALVHGARIFGPETREWTYSRKDGSRLQVSLIVSAMRDGGDEIIGYLAIATDITGRLRQQRELLAARDQLQLAAEVAHLGVWSWTTEDGRLSWNRRMFEIYAQSQALQEDLQYRHWRERVHPEDLERAEAGLRAALAGERPFDEVFRVVHPDGDTRYVQAAAQVERDDKGRPIRVTGINLDVTEQRAYEQNLLRAMKQAEQASVVKSQFLANMSHEIRTPMNAVLGLLQLLLHTRLDERQRDYVGKTQTAAKSLLGLLNDILDFSKMDAGKLQLDIHPFDLEGLMRDLSVVLSANNGDRNVEVLFRMDPELPSGLRGDRLRLLQILINLAGNALKFTSQGQVVVALTELARDQEAVRLRIEVSDTGIGIAPEQLARIFDGFTQAEASTTRRFGGTGLGLVISKRLIELMGGQLQVESQLGHGSRFWFELALEMSDETPLVPTPAVAKDSLRILVVDDNPLAGEILVNTIKQLGWRAEYAEGGEEALACARRLADKGERYDVALMDWRMPQMDGLGVAERMRRELAGDRPPVIIMVTAFGREVLAEAVDKQNAPFSDFLTKPVTPQQLVDVVERSVGRLGAPSEPAVSGDEAMGRRLAGMRILLVEDNALNRQVASALLEEEGARVEVAEGGLPGVAMATQAASLFDIVIMDVQMPDIDGLEATRRIRADARGQALPILAMTANASHADREACLAAGMNDHVGKPIDIDELVPKLLALSGYAASPGRAAAKPAPDGGEVEPLESRLRRFGNRLPVYRAALSTFRQECRELLRQIGCVDGADESRRKAEAIALHTLKGLAATMGASALSARAAELERLVKTGEEPQWERESAELASMLERGADRLESSLPPPEPPAPATEAEGRDRGGVLREIMAMLDDSNLAVVDLVEELGRRGLGLPEDALRQLERSVARLDFDEAARIVKTLLAAA
ncbi:PAS domain S-box protein [Chromobacterium alticapitis]|uniref:Sensory/regulatory protein RpfC n=1 Tax=Chromobacterium alticapitis TaxID=2073169 RepID=A0A2S5DEC9_9NEIS|nr:PAS domain S-box protein [Chromobacterium alticapitis]POZ61465.1 two-component system sensor histidine kinase/response regulator [Chromobacterium alticapitis]